ncbi:MAG: hypothetical protein KKB37_10865, partial [Alphaproteobacteria bacterium]|nr:hypothetical protein [Alphaproteobacteria bacterium]
VPIIIPASISSVAGIDDSIEHRIRNAKGIGGILRDLQRHVVLVPRRVRGLLSKNLETIAPNQFGDQFVILRTAALYSREAGLRMDDPTWRSVESNLF